LVFTLPSYLGTYTVQARTVYYWQYKGDAVPIPLYGGAHV
jgi:hypothetical protein